MRERTYGFTLIELMIVVAIVAILVAIALPAYNEQVRKSRRSDAYSAVGGLQLRLEKWRADCPSYASAGCAAGLTYPAMPTSNFYTFSLAGQTASDYSITATPAGAQVGDRCANLVATRNTKPTWSTAACN